ncbi:MAG: S9 family peptidase [Flavobacteriales bacterium]|nr:S9 family peptidase [Flavobacteriales bacterium]
MSRIFASAAAFALLAACTEQPKEEVSLNLTPPTYPETRQDTAAGDTLHGTWVPDPYRWLEDDLSEETADWVKRQNEVTEAWLAQVPFRSSIAKRYEDLYNFPKVSAPVRIGDLYFQYRNSGLQNQSVIYVRKGIDGEDTVFIDPNAIDPAGTTSINLSGASLDRRYMVVNVQKAGSDWQELEIWDLSTMTRLSDKLEWVKFSGASWFKDGFFYSRFPEVKEGSKFSAASLGQMVYYHKVGTPQSQDVLVHSDPANPNRYVGVGVTEGEEFATLYISTGTDGFEQYYHDLRTGGLPKQGTPWVALQRGFDFKTSIADYDHVHDRLLVRTNVNAPNYRLVAVDPKKPAQEHWVDVLPHKDFLLESAGLCGGQLFAEYLKDVTTRIYRYEPDGSNEREIKLPGLGSAGGFSGRRDHTYTFYSFTNFTDPGTIYKYDIASGTSEIFFRPELKFDPDQFETKQVFYPSKDGTKVPLFIVHKKGLKLDGNNPTLLYAYGGFNISLSPSFSTSRIILLEQGGVYALANLRGGGEYGEAWHQAGMKEKKQNVFDDFIAAGEYLIKEKYTRKEKLGIQGGSNGGLLVGAVMTQRPDLFQVAFPQVGVLDMLRFQKFSAGFGWTPEYGNADNSPEELAYLKAYSPLHNVKPGTAYPATLVMTADHDDRVVPAHSFKFVSALQAAHTGPNPVLIRVDVQAGHGAGKPTSKIIEEQADIWSFFWANVGFTPTYPEAASAIH